MDLANAAILGAVVLGLVAYAKKLIFGTNQERIVVFSSFVIAVISVFLVRQSVWAKEQIIGGQSLKNLDVWSCFVIVVFVIGIASTAWEVLGAVKNIGQNQVKAPNLSGIDGPKVK